MSRGLDYCLDVCTAEQLIKWSGDDCTSRLLSRCTHNWATYEMKWWCLDI